MIANYQNFQPRLFLESKYLNYNQNEINTILLNEGLSDFKMPTIPKNFDFKKTYMDLNNNAYKYLNKFKITKAEINKLVLQVKSNFTSTKDPSKAAKDIITVSYEFVKSKLKTKTFIESIVENKNQSITKKVILSIILTVVLTLINTFTVMLFPPPIGYIIVCGLIAPIIEEYAKRIAIKEKMPWLYVSIFSGIELVVWVVQLVLIGMNPIQVILIRILPVMMHFYTTLIQKKWHDRSERKKDPHYSKVGFFIAVLIHMLWNFTSITRFL